MGRRTFVAALASLSACALAAPASAATTRIVDPAAGPYTTITAALLAAEPGDTVDIHQANYDEQLWVDKDDITLRAAPGTIVSSTSPWVVSLMGRRATLDGLFVAGGPGAVRIEGDGAIIRNARILADATGVGIVGPIHTTIDRTTIRATALAGIALRARNTVPGDQRTTLTTSIVTGGRQGTALDVVTGQVGDSQTVGGADVDLVFSTVAGAPTAVARGALGMGGPVTVDNINSLVLGEAPPETAAQGAATSAGTFVDAAALDFHLRQGAPVAGVGVMPPGMAWPATDFDGVARAPFAQTRGAYVFVDHPPVATLTASADIVRQGTTVRFDASGSHDPDVGGRIVQYVWAFGDGSAEATTTEPYVEHQFLTVGRPKVGVRANADNNVGTTSALLPITVTDAIAPELRITSPRAKAKLHRYRTVKRKGKKRRLINVLKLGGRVSDAGGVARVELTLRRTDVKKARPGTCTFLDAARRRVAATPCTTPPAPIRAALRGDAWSGSTPSRLAVPAGKWELTARATDRAGNLATSVLHFTVT